MSQIIRNRTMQQEAVDIPVISGANVRVSALAPEIGAHKGTPALSKESLVHFEDLAVASLSDIRTQPPAIQNTEPEQSNRLDDERERAHQLGFEQGLQAGRAAAQGEYENILRRTMALLAACQAEVNASLERLDDDLVELVFVAITRVLGAAAVTREGALAVIQNVMEGQRDKRTPMVVHLSAADWDMLGEEGRELLVGDKPIRLIADDKIDIGGCLIETDRGTLDGRLETQLAKMKQTLVDCHAGRSR